MIRMAVLAALFLATTARAAIDDRMPGAAPPDIRYRDDRIVLRLSPDAARAAASRGAAANMLRALPAVDRVASRLGARGFRPQFARIPAGAPALGAFWYAELQPGSDPIAAANALAALDEVVSANAIALVPVTGLFPNDSLWSVARHLHQPSRRDVGAIEAWSVTYGDSAVVLGIVDTGVLLDHPDLAGQLWTNRAEASGLPGVDDDGNGHVDDVRGWDFVALPEDTFTVPLEDWRDQDNDPNDYAGHGTAVAGIAAAHTDNGIGVAGLGRNIRLMPLRVGWAAPAYPLGVVDLSAAAEAIVYAAVNGAAVLNCSFSTTLQDDLQAAIAHAVREGVVVVFSSGNNGSRNATWHLPGVITVAAVDPNDVVTPFSNRGVHVSLAAPGLGLPTTFIGHAGGDSLSDRQPTYTTGASGTSFSAPLAAAAAALLQSQRAAAGLPPLAPFEIKLRLMESAANIEPLNVVRGFGSGRLDAGASLQSNEMRSFHVRAAGRSIGPAIIVPAVAGETRLAFAMSTGEILFIGVESRDTLGLVPLPARPAGPISAADGGLGFGTLLCVPLEDGRVHVCDLRGRPVAGWPPAPEPPGPLPGAGVTLADLDGDDAIEIVWGDSDGMLQVWHATGTPLPGFPRRIGPPGSAIHLAVANLDQDPGLELVAAGSQRLLFAVDGDGSDLPGWPQGLPGDPDAVLIAELNGDGRPEIICAAGMILTSWASSGLLRFYVSMSKPVLALAAADMTGDGRDEIIAGLEERVTVFDSVGASVSEWAFFAEGFLDGPPVVGGVSRQDTLGILTSVVHEDDLHRIYGFERKGVRISRFPLPGDAGGALVIADIDADGATEVVAGSGRDSLLWVYDAGDSTWHAAPWPTLGGCSARTYSSTYRREVAPLDDVPPGRIVDLRVARIDALRVRATWSRATDAGPTGRPARYELAVSGTPFDPGSFAQADMRLEVVDSDAPELSIVIEDIPLGRSSYFAIRSHDAMGNASPPSDLMAFEPVATLPRGVDLAVLRNPGRAPVEVSWLAAADAAGRLTLEVYDVSGRRIRRLTLPPALEGIERWDGADEAGNRASPGLYFLRLSAPGAQATVRLVLLD